MTRPRSSASTQRSVDRGPGSTSATSTRTASSGHRFRTSLTGASRNAATSWTLAAGKKRR
ncbi:Uncharacterised protein [Mycobacteroides abscessus]|nr:Uncharacterised protein [Mycobacteroides abscessus]